MRWKLTILVLTLALLACNLALPAQPVPGVLPSPTLEPPSPTETPTPNIIPATPIPAPSQTPSATQTPITSDSGTDFVTEGNRIQFPAGSTWVEVGAHLEEDTSIEYVLSAIQGQVMGVSIAQSQPFNVEVADSTGFLSDPDYQHSFWRGTLPATGDYFITVKTSVSGDFTLRVAINPPGEARQYFDYVSPQGTAALRYSDEFAPTIYNPIGQFTGKSGLILEFIRTEFYRPTTTLSEAYFIFSETNDPQKVATCKQFPPQFEATLEQKTINGLDFIRGESISAAAGNIYDWIIYRTEYNSVCYDVVFFMHSTNIYNYTPGTVEEYDRVALLQKFESILSTLNVK
ncbi:MAG: hypothetical protein PVJ21_14870 [Anaerolineales bacterium]|jgi:hypothetical protein